VNKTFPQESSEAFLD